MRREGEKCNAANILFDLEEARGKKGGGEGGKKIVDHITCHFHPEKGAVSASSTSPASMGKKKKEKRGTPNVLAGGEGRHRY